CARVESAWSVGWDYW
nr:immunoglobulin heavy chain junction region [Macaca mulatta]MOX62339.1 immunoglobulin heavy chain junction region [Macaca mulatta]MOX62806.1 immunoglobulin heavy chain junction region [Macaca mulatta]MOX63124.1 immunoglobulin heavy chain junction region [Macaca mulatta]MOX64372.1 immunoglobulin heavy chain junction region [Macaca mulatta]